MDKEVYQAATCFFNDFVDAFRSFDGEVIAQRYLTPYLASHVGKPSDCFTTQSAIAEYFQGIVDEYHQKGCRSCRYEELEVVPLGEASVLATVSWELLHEDGRVLSRWRESYNLARDGEGLKVFCSIDHAG